MPEFATAEKVAEHIGCQPSTIRAWARKGIIPQIRLTNKVRRFDMNDVVAALKNRSAGTLPVAAQ